MLQKAESNLVLPSSDYNTISCCLL